MGTKKPLMREAVGGGRGVTALPPGLREQAPHVFNPNVVLELFPDTAEIKDGVLWVGGVSCVELAEEYGTPLVVYCEETLSAAARSWRRGAGDATVVYGTKAFPNVPLMRLLAEEGIGADVSTLGEM